MTKKDVSEVMFSSDVASKLVWENHGLGLMHQKERLLLNKAGAIRAESSPDGEVHDMIANQELYEKYYALRKEVEKDRKYARLNGLNELAAGR